MIANFAAAALAYEINDADWSAREAPVDEPLRLNAESFAVELDPDLVEEAYQRALDTWNAEGGADLYLEYGGRSTSTQRGGGDDDENVTFFGGYSFGAGIAITTWGYIDETVNDCDTEFHDENLYGAVTWHAGEDAAPNGLFDIQHTMTHETGHCLGLGHSTFDDAIMRTYTTDGTGDESRHLTADDRAGIQEIYGRVQPELALTAGAVVDDEVTLTIGNVGDGTAWFVVASIDGDDRDLGHIGSDTPVGNRVGPSEITLDVACGASIPIELADRIGNTWDFDVEATCFDDGPDDTEDTEDSGDPEAPGEAVGCGCASGGSPMAAFGAVLLLLTRRARRR